MNVVSCIQELFALYIFFVTCFRLRSSLKSVMKERIIVQRDMIDIEAVQRDLQVKVYRKVCSLHSKILSKSKTLAVTAVICSFVNTG